jgi:anti-sigma factor ChrR (cupin superfamily)
MSSGSDEPECEHTASVSLYALQALPPSEAARMDAHIATCTACRDERDALRPIVQSFVSWPTDVLRPPSSMWERLAARITTDPGREPVEPTTPRWREPEWEEVAPGIFCKVLAMDSERVSMLVRLGPGVAYPPHLHAGVEELHLLDGELWIDDRKLYPGDYSRAEPGTSDTRVWSEAGCTCVLITSPRDVFG